MNSLTKEQVIKFLKMGFAVSADHFHEDVFAYLDGERLAYNTGNKAIGSPEDVIDSGTGWKVHPRPDETVYTGEVSKWGLPVGTELVCVNTTISNTYTIGNTYTIVRDGGYLSDNFDHYGCANINESLFMRNPQETLDLEQPPARPDNKDLNELFNIEAAIDCLSSVYKDGRHIADKLRYVLKAATAGREYQLKPQVRDWMQGEETPKTPFKCKVVGSQTTITVEEQNEISGCLCRFDDNSIAIIHSNDLKPIPPKTKKIDHSSLVGSGIDCTYRNGDTWYQPYKTCAINEFKSVRFNHPMVLEKYKVQMLKDIGYTVGVMHKFIEDGVCYMAVIVTGVANGWEL